MYPPLRQMLSIVDPLPSPLPQIVKSLGIYLAVACTNSTRKIKRTAAAGADVHFPDIVVSAVGPYPDVRNPAPRTIEIGRLPIFSVFVAELLLARTFTLVV
jgi:hypothetical protein